MNHQESCITGDNSCCQELTCWQTVFEDPREVEAIRGFEYHPCSFVRFSESAMDVVSYSPSLINKRPSSRISQHHGFTFRIQEM
jgi:hypothetical protein